MSKEPKLEQWNTVNQMWEVSGLFDDLITEVTNKYGPGLTLQALCLIVGRWSATQDQTHINAHGLNPRQLMHQMVDYFFDAELKAKATAANGETLDA